MTTMTEERGVGLDPAGVKASITWRIDIVMVRDVVIEGKVQDANVIVIVDETSRTIMHSAIGQTSKEVAAALCKVLSENGAPHRLLIDRSITLDLGDLLCWGTKVEVRPAGSPSIKRNLEYLSQRIVIKG